MTEDFQVDGTTCLPTIPYSSDDVRSRYDNYSSENFQYCNEYTSFRLDVCDLDQYTRKLNRRTENLQPAKMEGKFSLIQDYMTWFGTLTVKIRKFARKNISFE